MRKPEENFSTPFINAAQAEGDPRHMPKDAAEMNLFVFTTLTRLEAQMDSLLGNGQPGRIQRVERRAQIAERFAWVLTGGLVLLALVVGWTIQIASAIRGK